MSVNINAYENEPISMKYEKPELIDISKKAKGYGEMKNCTSGSSPEGFCQDGGTPLEI